MALFSERENIKPIKNELQIESIDNDLRNSLWNCFFIYYWNPGKNNSYYSNMMQCLFYSLVINYFKRPVDEFSKYWEDNYEFVKKYFFSCNWYEVYDFVEFIANSYEDDEINNNFIEKCNEILKRELSVWRFVDKKIIRINSDIEITQIEETLNISKPFKSINIHLQRALELLSDRKSPDYRNSIKESISAVEALCKKISKDEKSDLSKALKEIEKENKLKIHPALKEALIKLYGYTSDENGIRHAIMDETNIDQEDALFMLVSCSAFINYLIVKIDKSGLKI